VIENRQPKGSQCLEIRFLKIQDGGRPPSWISILGHNFGADKHFCAKFGTVMENQQPKGSHCSEIRFLKIQDGGRPPSWISILGQRLRVFSVKFIAKSSIQSMMNDPKRGRGQGHVTYF